MRLIHVHQNLTDSQRGQYGSILRTLTNRSLSQGHLGESPTDEQGQSDEIAPADDLPQDHGREQRTHEHAQLVDGDDHAGGAVLEGPAVAEPEGTRRSLQGEDGVRLAHKVLS